MVDVTVDATPKPHAPYDPEVIPDAVKRRAAAVDALYAQSADPPPTNGQNGAPPTPDSGAPPSEQLVLPLVAPVAQASDEGPSSASPTPAAAPAVEEEGDWKRRYLRMQGQFNASQKTIGEMQEQMTQLGNELLYAQQHAFRPQAQSPMSQLPPPPSYLTEKDVQDYGTDLIDVTQRAALHAVAPHLQNLEQQNAMLQQRLAKEARRGLDQAVELAVPNFREIDRDPRWHRWLLGVDVFSGRVRQTLLDEAIASAQAPRVVSFFRGFLQEEAATGQRDSASASSQAAPPRTPAIDLSSLAAPGRARPATGGDTSGSTDKPVYTRARVKELYEQHRRGAYVGREADWARLEADFFAAQREGRYR
jgi:hypothetical protein